MRVGKIDGFDGVGCCRSSAAKFATQGFARLLACPGLFTGIGNIINIVGNPGVGRWGRYRIVYFRLTNTLACEKMTTLS